MGSLLEIVRNYEPICKNDYIYKLRNGTEIKVVFKKSNLPHLLGLHKLKDIEEFRKLSEKEVAAQTVYKRLKSGSITFEQISNSEYFHEIENRLKHIQNLEQLVFERVILDFDASKLKTKLKKVTVLFYVKIGSEYIHLPLVYNKSGYYAPNTLLVQRNRYYIDNQDELTVESLTVMNKGKVIKTIEYNNDQIQEVA